MAESIGLDGRLGLQNGTQRKPCRQVDRLATRARIGWQQPNQCDDLVSPTTIDLSMLCEASDNRWNLAELESAYRSVESLVRPESPSWLSEPSQQFLATVAGCTRATPMVYQRLCRRGRRWLPCELLRADKGRVAIVRGVADRLIWENETVVGVHVRGEHDDFDLRASDGVVITAGAIATPLILMRSGVGTREDLDRHGIDARLECSALGNHLSDHLIMPVVFERQTSSEPFRALPTMQDLARWQVMGSGPIASNLAECGGLFQDQSLQFHVTPTHYLTYPKQDAVASMTIGVNVTQPQSTGQIRLRSKRPEVAPEIAPGYLNHEADLAGTLVGIRLARELAERSPLAESIRLELIPGDKRSSDDALTRAIGRYAQTLYHPVGTCRIGQVADSVIDHNFAVRGSSNLWVVDASILPGPTVGNPNATVMTLAWWAAERIAHQL